MGTRRDGRIDPGQPLGKAISARAWNRAQDAADIVLGSGGSAIQANGMSYDRPVHIVIVKNNSGQAVPRFGVLSISGVAIDPNISEATGNTFADRPVLIGDRPNPAVFGDKFVVCPAPIANNRFGEGIIGGVFSCKVRINNTNHNYAMPLLDDNTQLQSTSCGPVLLIWKDIADWEAPYEDDRWAVGVM